MNVLVISDLHIPFQHKDAFDFLDTLKKTYKIDFAVCVGDEIDSHALSDYDTDPDGLSAGQELTASIEQLETLYKKFPKLLLCTSNHTSRIYRRALKYGIPKAYLKTYNEFLQAPKDWKWADYHEVDGVIYEHGDPYSGQNAAKKIAEANMQSTVIGHIHSFAGIQYIANSKHLIFGFNVGCLIDKDSYAMAYGSKLKSKPVLGCGIVEDGIPRFIPMLLNKHGRWIGKL